MDTMSSYLTYSRCCKTLPTISCVSIAVESVSSVAAAIVASSYVVAILLTLVIYFVTFIALYIMSQIMILFPNLIKLANLISYKHTVMRGLISV